MGLFNVIWCEVGNNKAKKRVIMDQWGIIMAQ